MAPFAIIFPCNECLRKPRTDRLLNLPYGGVGGGGAKHKATLAEASQEVTHRLGKYLPAVLCRAGKTEQEEAELYFSSNAVKE